MRAQILDRVSYHDSEYHTLVSIYCGIALILTCLMSIQTLSTEISYALHVLYVHINTKGRFWRVVAEWKTQTWASWSQPQISSNVWGWGSWVSPKCARFVGANQDLAGRSHFIPKSPWTPVSLRPTGKVVHLKPIYLESFTLYKLVLEPCLQVSIVWLIAYFIQEEESRSKNQSWLTKDT